ncbi:MAG: YaaA family protein [Leucobacter sp.]
MLLPPSETKVPGGEGLFDPDVLTHGAALSGARARVRTALESISRDEAAATRALGVGVKSRSEIAHNLRLTDSGVRPAIERYTGVLYDALDAPTLPPHARGWVDRHVQVQSALFGLIGAAERIPAYRLSAGSRLSSLGQSLKSVWRDAHAAIDWDETEFVLDLRSQAYAELAPLTLEGRRSLHVVQRTEDGSTRALNHFNKLAKGDLVRRLALSGAGISSPDEFREWSATEGIEIAGGPSATEFTLVTQLGVPSIAADRFSPVDAAG